MMPKSPKITDEQLLLNDFERERLLKADGQMVFDQLSNKQNKGHATLGQVRRKLAQLNQEDPNSSADNDD